MPVLFFAVTSVNIFIVRHKGGQVSPAQQTGVTQFTSSDIEIQKEQDAQSSSAAVLQGRQGTPAGKLPPIQSLVRSRSVLATAWNNV